MKKNEWLKKWFVAYLRCGCCYRGIRGQEKAEKVWGEEDDKTGDKKSNSHNKKV